MPEFPPPIRLLGEPPLPDEPYADHAARDEPPADDRDLFGAEHAAAVLSARLESLRAAPARVAGDGRLLLSPPFSLARDHVAGPLAAPRTLVVFGAFGTPASRALGRVIEELRYAHPATVRIAWRHYPDPEAHPHAVVLALAAEAAAARGRFWALTMALLRMRHNDPPDLHAAFVRAGLDPDLMLAAMRAGTGADRIAADVASALSSGVAYSPALFVDGERYDGEPAIRTRARDV
jgi:2-hydroxychromene-2-carboxylate isomerase